MVIDLYYDLSGNGITSPIQLVERKEGMFKNIFNCEGYIYKLDATNFKSGLTNWSAEVVSDKDENVFDCYYVKNVYEELVRLDSIGDLELYLYPRRPEHVPIDNSDLIFKVIKWKQNGFSVNRFYDLYPELKDKFLAELKKYEEII